jgi:cysteine desulfurase/selenocysteine lyase
MIDKKIKKDFPIFKAFPSLIYFDSGATTQKPSCVIDFINDYYSNHYGTVHRSIYNLAMQSTNLYDASRKKVKEFINARSEDEIVFTRGTTDSINLVARSLGIEYIKEGDEIISTEMEHHSNLVPWQMLSKEKKAVLKIVPINEKAELDLEAFKKLLSSKTKLVCVGHVSNSTGTVNPIKKIIELAHEKKALVLIDGSQGAPHMKLDMQDLDADFYAFSGHKMYGPTGVGVLYGKKALLDMMPPVQGGGDMIEEVQLYSSTYQKTPLKFEAGTPPFAQVIGLKRALDYIDSLGKENIIAHEQKLLHYGTEKMEKIPGLKIIGTAKEKGPIISFVVDKIHPFDIGTLLDTKGIAIRTGHHCAQPTMRKFKIPGTARVSFGVYNSIDEIDNFIEALKKVISELK